MREQLETTGLELVNFAERMAGRHSFIISYPGQDGPTQLKLYAYGKGQLKDASVAYQSTFREPVILDQPFYTHISAVIAAYAQKEEIQGVMVGDVQIRYDAGKKGPFIMFPQPTIQFSMLAEGENPPFNTMDRMSEKGLELFEVARYTLPQEILTAAGISIRFN